jgi:hypothetical protein
MPVRYARDPRCREGHLQGVKYRLAQFDERWPNPHCEGSCADLTKVIDADEGYAA